MVLFQDAGYTFTPEGDGNELLQWKNWGHWDTVCARQR